MMHTTEPACWLALSYGADAPLAANISPAHAKAMITGWCLADRQPLAAPFQSSAAEMAARTDLTPGEGVAILDLRGEISKQAAWLTGLAQRRLRP